MGSFEQSLSQGMVWAFLAAFGSGLATSLTPCVYPMIPITVSLFGARESRSRWAAFLLASCYVLGIASMYAGLGVLAAMAGWAAPGAILASPWFVLPLGLLFLALATSMFGLWDIRLPAALQTRMSAIGGKGYKGAFAMGLVGGILIAPCTGPWLAGLLGYVATTRSVLFGASLLFTYALGVGVLFLVIATFAVAMPKSGPWMDGVKTVLGIALVTATLYYTQNVIAPLARYTSARWWFAGLNLAMIVVGIAMGGVHLSYMGARVLTATRKTVGILLVAAGAFGVVNFALAPDGELPWIHSEAKATALARKQGRPTLVDFSAKWCVPCREIEAAVLNDPAVRRQLKRFVLFKVDVTNDTPRDRRLQQKYGRNLPLMVLLDAKGRERARAGKIGISEMLALLRRVR